MDRRVKPGEDGDVSSEPLLAAVSRRPVSQ
jgi:hypothetical protein